MRDRMGEHATRFRVAHFDSVCAKMRREIARKKSEEMHARILHEIEMVRTVIIATGSHIPAIRVPNEHFLDHDFRGTNQQSINKPNEEIFEQFEAITTIRERRYAPDEMVTIDLAYEAARDALQSSNIDPETLDGIIVAHNFGDVRAGSLRPISARHRRPRQVPPRHPQSARGRVRFGCPDGCRA
jgi:3-oxoacyl-[acyl-carrier-protein] synthase-3